MESRFKGKVAVVTGGTRGIGGAISLKLASEGAKVFALYARDRTHAEALETAARGLPGEVRTIRGDLTADESFNAVVEQINAGSDRVDILVHSAASGVHRDAMDLTMKHFRWTFEINVFAFHNLMRALVPRMPAGAKVVGITSSGGTRVIPHYAAIGASKGAMESLLRHYAQELAPKGILVNALCPGLVLTDATEAFPDRETRIQVATERTPTGRLTTVEDVAEAAAFLCSDANRQFVGQTLTLDGGKTLLS